MKPAKKMWEETRTPTPTSIYALANLGLSCSYPCSARFPRSPSSSIPAFKASSLPPSKTPANVLSNLSAFIYYLPDTSERACTRSIGILPAWDGFLLLYLLPCRGQPPPSDAARTCSGGTRGPLCLLGTGKRDYSATRGLLPQRSPLKPMPGRSQPSYWEEIKWPELGSHGALRRDPNGQGHAFVKDKVSFRERLDPPSK